MGPGSAPREVQMARVKLDDIDRNILANLQASGRMTNVRLARNVGISPPPCLRRVRALETAGFIKGYHAEVDAAGLGYGVTVFAQVGLHSQAESDLVAFEERVREWSMVRECYMLAAGVKGIPVPNVAKYIHCVFFATVHGDAMEIHGLLGFKPRISDKDLLSPHYPDDLMI